MGGGAIGSWKIEKAHLMPRLIDTLDGFNPIMFVHALAGAVLGDFEPPVQSVHLPAPRASAIVLGVMPACPARRVCRNHGGALAVRRGWGWALVVTGRPGERERGRVGAG